MFIINKMNCTFIVFKMYRATQAFDWSRGIEKKKKANWAIYWIFIDKVSPPPFPVLLSPTNSSSEYDLIVERMVSRPVWELTSRNFG